MKRGISIIPAVLFVLLFHSQPASCWECSVDITGPTWVKIDNTINLTASGLPVGGSYSWSATPNLVPGGSTATLTGFQPTFSDYIRVTVRYTAPKGNSCTDTKWIYAHSCGVEIAGPVQAEAGQPVSLTATAEPTGGKYQWSISQGTGTLSGQDAAATFTSDQVGEGEIEVVYTPPNGNGSCTDSHTITVSEKCSVDIVVDQDEISLGGTVHLLPVAVPEGGFYDWVPADGLVPHYSADLKQDGPAAFTPGGAGNQIVYLKYTTPTGKECFGDQSITAYKVTSLTPKAACFDTGYTLQSSDFDLLTTPTGHESSIKIVPETVSTLFQTENVLVTGSCGDGTMDDATTKILVVNKEVEEGVSIDFKIPNYVNDALKVIGVGDKTDLTFGGGFSKSMQCCSGISAKNFTSGYTTIGLNIDAGPFTIIGIPLPASLEKFVKLKALSVTVTGSGNGTITGDYDGCQDIIKWSGSGSLSAGIKATGEVRAKTPGEVVVIKGTLAGSTAVSEILTVESSRLIMSGNWEGLTVKGEVKLIIGKVSSVSRNAEKKILSAEPIPPMEVKFPSLN